MLNHTMGKRFESDLIRKVKCVFSIRNISQLDFRSLKNVLEHTGLNQKLMFNNLEVFCLLLIIKFFFLLIHEGGHKGIKR